MIASPTLDELRKRAVTSEEAAQMLRLHLALARIALGGDRLRLQQIAIDALRDPPAVVTLEGAHVRTRAGTEAAGREVARG